MRSYKTVTIEIATTHELSSLVETYQEVAAGKMQKIRHETMMSRAFFEGLAQLSEAVGADMVQGTMGRTPKTAVVWVAANAGLFGDIIEKTLVAFLHYIRQKPVDVFVLGAAGAQLLSTLAPDVRCTAIPFADDEVTVESMTRLTNYLSGYETTVIFFGKFQSVAIQNADKRVISAALHEDGLNVIDQKERLHREFTYIYEPTPRIVSRCVADEIFGAVVEQTIRESQLAKYASRLMHLDEAMDHVDDRLKTLSTEKRKIKKIREDRKQRIMLAGMKTQGRYQT